MHNARIPPVDPAPATITAVVAMHAGHICHSLRGGQVQILMQVPDDLGVTSVAGLRWIRGLSRMARCFQAIKSILYEP